MLSAPVKAMEKIQNPPVSRGKKESPMDLFFGFFSMQDVFSDFLMFFSLKISEHEWNNGI